MKKWYQDKIGVPQVRGLNKENAVNCYKVGVCVVVGDSEVYRANKSEIALARDGGFDGERETATVNDHKGCGEQKETD